MLFIMLAFMAHWMLGGDLPDFGTFSDAVSAQARMIFGEFIYASGADKLSGSMITMYWLYAFTFMVVVFFTLLNFFLAIIVDAFSAVKTENEEQVVVCSFPYDCYASFATMVLSRRSKWPSSDKLLEFFEGLTNKGAQRKSWIETLEHEEDGSGEGDCKKPTCTPAEIVEAFEHSGIPNNLECAKFITHYYAKSPLVLCRRKVEEKCQKKPSKTSSNTPSLVCKRGDINLSTTPSLPGTPQVVPPSGSLAMLPRQSSRPRKTRMSKETSVATGVTPVAAGNGNSLCYSALLIDRLQELLKSTESSEEARNGVRQTMHTLVDEMFKDQPCTVFNQMDGDFLEGAFDSEEENFAC